MRLPGATSQALCTLDSDGCARAFSFRMSSEPSCACGFVWLDVCASRLYVV